jgi:ABC-type Fe3+ transport system substrate-binding protein
MSDVFMVLPPNILRRAEDVIAKKFPEIALRPHHTHAEMDEHFSHYFGREEYTAELTVSAYPQALYRAADSDLFAEMPAELPPIRPELAELGLAEAPAYVKVIGVVPVVLIHNTGIADPPGSWQDLSKERWWGNVVAPPHDTPLPALFRYYMESNFGNDGASAADALHPELYPLDINKYVDEGRFQAGLAIPAFGRNFRLGSGAMVWPTEGAVAVPVMAFLRKDAAPPAKQLLAYLLSPEFQEFMSTDGLICPVLQEAPLFLELVQNQFRFIWAGWDAAIEVGGQLARKTN